jgi:aminoglycoside phosphotransferase (APT) family kinase protein
LPSFLQPDGDEERVRRRALEIYGDRSRRLLRRIQEIERIEVDDTLGHDLVHPDYGLGNVLFDETGAITGIVDWNGGATRGDHRFALLKLSINVEAEGDLYGVEPDARNRLDEIVQTLIDPKLLRLYWSEWTLRKVSHAIQHGFPAERIAREVSLGGDRLA